MYTLFVFVGLSKDCYTVDHRILLTKLELNAIRGYNHNSIEDFLPSSKQYIEIDPTVKTSLKLVKCGVPQGLVLAQLLFLLYVSNFKICFKSP